MEAGISVASTRSGQAGIFASLAGRTFVAMAVLGYFAAGVAVIGAISANVPVHRLTTSFDAAIPFVPWTIFIYSWAYTLGLYPLFVVRCPRLFRRVALAYVTVLTVQFFCFLIFPVTSLGLRADPSMLDLSTFAGWGVRITYAIDPPYNLFPSMHVSLALVGAYSAWKASRLYGSLAAIVTAGIVLTICTTKQHYVIDGVVGLALGALVSRLVLEPYEAEGVPMHERRYGAAGAAAYFAFHAAFYLAFYVAFRAGLRLW